MWRKEDVVAELKSKQGKRSLRSYARNIECSASYLSDIYRGTRNPGPKILEALDLECEVTVTYQKRRWKVSEHQRPLGIISSKWGNNILAESGEQGDDSDGGGDRAPECGGMR